jgi:hypothetical protein
MAKYEYTEIISCGCKVHKESPSNKVNIIFDLKFYVHCNSMAKIFLLIIHNFEI